MRKLSWLSGTAYDFFISLQALHHAPQFGLRPSWAAGVRQRLSSPSREILEKTYSFASLPVDWVSSLPEPRDAAALLAVLEGMDARQRLQTLLASGMVPEEVHPICVKIATHGKASQAERETLKNTLFQHGKGTSTPSLDFFIRCWSDPERQGSALVQALQEYQHVFFADEENRLRPALQAGLEKARALAMRVNLEELVESLSHGVHFEDMASLEEITLVPSWWLSPFVIPSHPQKARMQIVFGCREDNQGIIPGGETPDALITALKSLADPTRLRILRHLHGGMCTPTELSHLLRLRTPTVLHHLQALRLAGLVAIRVSEAGEKRYTTRLETIPALLGALEDFIKGGG